MKNFPSQRMLCNPIRKVGTRWEASQDVGMASYKTVFYVYVKTGFYLVFALVLYLLNALYPSKTQC